ncbi:hypothetical protein V1502_11040 [Bacillus sp. SCS-153A]|uniref:hypothetical protein n=1 Tax=Rossellomorea sedimentorum TaxID=3115294 RepID=UPI00390661E8
MRIILFLLIALPVLLVGCSSSDSNSLVDYDHSKLSSEFENEGIQPKLPTGFPVRIKGHERVIPPHETSRYETKFTGENGEIFTLIVHSGPVAYEEGMKKEDVSINGSEGFYTENEVTGPSLHWTEGKYHYILDYSTIALETEVNKETMMAIAESFE